MIYDDIKRLMQELMSPEEIEVFDDAVEVLEMYNTAAYLDALSMTVGMWSGIEAGTQADSLRDVITGFLNYILRMQGVELHDEVSMSERVKVARYLHELVNYDDAATLLSYLALDVSAEERFGELMHLVGEWSVENAMSLVQEIQPSFAANLAEIVQSREQKNTEDAALVAVQIRAYSIYKKEVVTRSLFSDMFFVNLPSIGLEFLTYVNLFQNSRDDFNIRPIKETVEDLMGLALLSGDGVKDPLASVRLAVSSMFSDSTQQTQAERFARELLSALSAEQAYTQA